MKKAIALFIVVVICSTTIFAQYKDEDKEPFFKKEKLFTGGSVSVGFATGQFSFALLPHFGFSVNKYVDVAISGNYNYISQRDEFSTLKVRQSILGPSAFIRVFPFRSVFAQAQYEYNFIKYKEIYGGGFPDQVAKVRVQSYLVGGGYCSGRGDTGEPFYYVSILFDLSDDIYSPYKDIQNRNNPIIRAGFHIPLFQGKGRRTSDD
jgi:hypothetical protein